MSRKKSIVEKELSNITIGGKIVMAVMLPIFAVVAGVEHIIAKLTGSTYNEVNIIVFLSADTTLMDSYDRLSD